jgi:RNA polymerase sigma-70 factor, ECF subfamily
VSRDDPSTDDGPATDLEADFAAFFAAHHDAVLRSLTATAGNDHDAAVDAVQDAFIKAHARWSTIRTYDQPEAWVRRIAINTSRDRRRSDRRRRDREVSVDATVTARADVADTERIDADAAMAELLGELPGRQREIASLYYVDDRSVEEVAATLGISAGTVKSQLAEARARLRRTHQG